MGIRISFSEPQVENFLSLDPLLEFYNRGDYSSFFDWLNNVNIKNFDKELNEVRDKINSISLPKDINDVSMNVCTEKGNEIRNATTFFFNNRRNFVTYAEIWTEVAIVINSLIKEEKDRISVGEDVRKLSSADLRSSEVNFRMNGLIKLKTKVDIYNSRLSHTSLEFNILMKELEGLKFENSRLVTQVGLALDTGEIPRVYWKQQTN